MLWMQASQWIDLHKVRLSFRIASQIDAASITTAENAPGREGDLLGSTDPTVLVGQYKPILDQVLTTFLVHIGIGVCFGMFFQNDLERAERTRVFPLANNAHRELAPRQIGLDQYGLLISCEELFADGG